MLGNIQQTKAHAVEISDMNEVQNYRSDCPRCLAAHDAGEKTALRLIDSPNGFATKYVAMAIVQDALRAFFNPPTSPNLSETEFGDSG